MMKSGGGGLKCARQGREEMRKKKFCKENMKRELRFEDGGIDGKIILEWTLWHADTFLGIELTKHVFVEIDS